MVSESEDLKLWTRLKQGDDKALDTIYRKYIDHLVNYGSKFTRNREIVEDCIHDLFVYIWKKRSNLSDTDSIRAYLLFSLRNRIIRTLKKSGFSDLGEQESLISVKYNTKEEEIIDIERKAELRFTLENSFDILSNREREAIYLKYYNGMDYRDICDIMDINYQSVRNLISRALKKLHSELKK